MIRIKMKIKEKLANVKSMRGSNSININGQIHMASSMTFQINLKKRFETLKEIDAGTFFE